MMPIEPEEAGFATANLEDLGEYLEEAGSSALVIVRGGRVVYEWGDTRRRHTVHSIRKALLNSLIGIEVQRGTIDTTATLAELRIDDRAGLTEPEKQARVADLLRSRSGVYHPAAAETAAMAEGRPPRGTHAPGEAFYYNNWDFNVLGVIYERATGRTIYDGFRQDIAEPLGMQEYSGRWTHTGPVRMTTSRTPMASTSSNRTVPITLRITSACPPGTWRGAVSSTAMRAAGGAGRSCLRTGSRPAPVRTRR